MYHPFQSTNLNQVAALGQAWSWTLGCRDAQGLVAALKEVTAF